MPPIAYSPTHLAASASPRQTPMSGHGHEQRAPASPGPQPDEGEEEVRGDDEDADVDVVHGDAGLREHHAVDEDQQRDGDADLAAAEEDAGQEVEERRRQGAQDDARKAPAEGMLARLDGRHRARRRDGQELLAILGRALGVGIQRPGHRLGAEPRVGEDDVAVGLDDVDGRPAAVGRRRRARG